MVPPLFASALWQRPHVQNISLLHQPANGGQPASSTLTTSFDFFLRLRGLFRGLCIRAFHQSLVLWMDRGPLLVPTMLVRCSIILLSCFLEEKKFKQKALHPLLRTKSVDLKYCSRGSTCICHHLTTATSASTYETYILMPDYGGIRCSSTLARSDFFSQLQGLLRDWSTCRLLSNHLLSVRNGYPLLAPSKLLFICCSCIKL